MRLLRLLSIGLYLFLGLALFCLSISSARSADGVTNSGQSTSTSSATSTVDIVPAKKVKTIDYQATICSIDITGPSSLTLQGCIDYLRNYTWHTGQTWDVYYSHVFDSIIYPTDANPNSGVKAYYDMVVVKTTSFSGLPLGTTYDKESSKTASYNLIFKYDYTCPNSTNPEYTIPTSKPDEANSEGKYCTKPEEKNPCDQYKGVQLPIAHRSCVALNTVCYAGCVGNAPVSVSFGDCAAEDAAGLPKYSWQTYTFTGESCSVDSNTVSDDVAKAANAAASAAQGTNPSSGSGTNPSSGTGTNPSSGTGTNPSSGTGTNPSSGTGTNPSSGSGTNPSSGTGTGSDPNCYGTNHGDVCNGTSGSSGTGNGSGGSSGGSGGTSGGTSGGASTSSAVPSASGAEGVFKSPTGSKDYLKSVFSADEIKKLKMNRAEIVTRINEKMASIKGLLNINSISVSGEFSSDEHEIKGAKVDLSGKSFFERFDISWAIYFVAILICMDIILNRRKK